MVTAVKQAEFKGISIAGVINAAVRMLGQDTVDAAIAALSGDSARYRHEKILAGGWYPISLYREVHASLQRAGGRGPELARELSRIAVANDLKGPYRFLLQILSPRTVMTWGPRLLSFYVRNIAMDITESRNGYVEIVYTVPGSDRSIWLDLSGGSEAIADLAGMENCRVRITQGGQDGDDRATFGIFWSMSR